MGRLSLKPVTGYLVALYVLQVPIELMQSGYWEHALHEVVGVVFGTLVAQTCDRLSSRSVCITSTHRVNAKRLL